MEKLAKRKNARSKGNAQLKPKRRNEEQEVASRGCLCPEHLK